MDDPVDLATLNEIPSHQVLDTAHTFDLRKPDDCTAMAQGHSHCKQLARYPREGNARRGYAWFRGRQRGPSGRSCYVQGDCEGQCPAHLPTGIDPHLTT